MWRRVNITAILIIAIVGSRVECSIMLNPCNDITSKSSDLRLKTNLFCDYDPEVRPETKDKNVTVVGMSIMRKVIEFVRSFI